MGELGGKKIVQENERLGEEFTVRGKLNTIKGNRKLKAEPSLQQRSISPDHLSFTVLCKLTLRNPHLAKPEKELQTGVTTYICIHHS